MGLVRNLCVSKIGTRNKFTIQAHHGKEMAIRDGIQYLAQGHARLPGNLRFADRDHYARLSLNNIQPLRCQVVTPLARSTSTTSGKSMPRRLTVSSVGMPSDVQPRLL